MTENEAIYTQRESVIHAAMIKAAIEASRGLPASEAVRLALAGKVPSGTSVWPVAPEADSDGGEI